MKLLLSLLFMLLLAATPALSQKRKASQTKAKRPAQTIRTATPPVPVYESDEPPPPPAPKPLGKESLSSGIFKDVAIGKWNILSISLPDDLTNEGESSTPFTNKNVAWINYSRSWKQAAQYYPSALEVDFAVTTWNADVKTIVPELKPELATPEGLLMLDLLGDMRSKNEPGSLVKETHPLEIGGVKGGYFLADTPAGNKRFLTGWYTYRYSEGKPQRISLTITGRKDELPKAMKIIQSLKMQ